MRFKSQGKLKSNFSGFISFIVLVLMTILAVLLLKELIKKSDQNLIVTPNQANEYLNITSYLDYENYDYKDPEIGLFFFAFKFINRTTDKDISYNEIKKLMYVEVTEKERTYATGNTVNLNVIDLVGCGSRFNYFAVPDTDVTSYYCPDITSFQTYGEYFAEKYRYLSIQVRDCSYQSNPNKNYCNPGDTILKEFTNIAIKMIYLVPMFDPDEINDKIPIKYSSKSLVVYPNFSIRFSADLYLSRSIISSYENLILYSHDPKKIAMTEVSKTVTSYSAVTSAYISLFFRSDKDYNNYTRRYKLLFTVLAELGGIWKILFFLGALFALPVNTKFLYNHLSNRIFNLISPDKDLSNENYETYLSKNDPQSPQREMKIENVTPLEAKMCIDYFKYERNKNIYYDFSDWFTELLHIGTENFKKKAEILDYAGRKLDKKLEINHIYNFTAEIKLMKYIIFNDVFIMLNLLRRRIVSKKDQKELIREYNFFVHDENSPPEKIVLLKAIFFILGLRALKAKPMIDDKIDKQIIGFLNIDKEILRKYFIAHYQIINNDNNEEGK